MKMTILLCACALVLAGSMPVFAQSRKSVAGHPVIINNPGESSPISRFTSSSYGLGNTQYGAPTTDILGSPSGAGLGSSSFDFSPKSTAGQQNDGILGNAMKGRSDQLYKGVAIKATGMEGHGAADTFLRRNVQMPMSEIFGQSDSRVMAGANKEDTIKSLVPSGLGLYHDYIEAGEHAFREGEFTLAFTKFQMANYIGVKDPESLLSMSHAQFAADSYPLAAYYLRQTLKYMPSLPTVRLQPKAFYSDPSLYVENVQRLDEYVTLHPHDTDAQLLRAYYYWFDTDEANSAQVATRALEMALAANNTPDTTQAIEAFWDGMVAAGKVKGRIRAATPMAKTPEKKVR
jgi:hypothetical protein